MLSTQTQSSTLQTHVSKHIPNTHKSRKMSEQSSQMLMNESGASKQCRNALAIFDVVNAAKNKNANKCEAFKNMFITSEINNFALNMADELTKAVGPFIEIPMISEYIFAIQSAIFQMLNSLLEKTKTADQMQKTSVYEPEIKTELNPEDIRKMVLEVLKSIERSIILERRVTNPQCAKFHSVEEVKEIIESIESIDSSSEQNQANASMCMNNAENNAENNDAAVQQQTSSSRKQLEEPEMVIPEEKDANELFYVEEENSEDLTGSDEEKEKDHRKINLVENKRAKSQQGKFKRVDHKRSQSQSVKSDFAANAHAANTAETKNHSNDEFTVVTRQKKGKDWQNFNVEQIRGQSIAPRKPRVEKHEEEKTSPWTNEQFAEKFNKKFEGFFDENGERAVILDPIEFLYHKEKDGDYHNIGRSQRLSVGITGAKCIGIKGDQFGLSGDDLFFFRPCSRTNVVIYSRKVVINGREEFEKKVLVFKYKFEGSLVTLICNRKCDEISLESFKRIWQDFLDNERRSYLIVEYNDGILRTVSPNNTK